VADNYAVKIEVWPYSTGAGAAADQAAVDPRERTFRVKARDFEDALTQARALRDGAASHNRVWQANIRSIDYQGTRP